MAQRQIGVGRAEVVVVEGERLLEDRGVLLRGDETMVFLVNLPIGVVAYWLCARSIVESRAPGRRELPDALGFALGAIALAAAAMAIVQAPESGAGSALVLGSAVVAVLAGALLVQRMRTRPSALVDSALLRMPGLTVTGLITAVGSAGFFALGLANMLYLMIVWRYSPLKAGLAMTPSPFFAAAAAVLAGQLAGRLDPRRMIMAGSLIGLAGSLLLITRMGSTPDYLGAYLPAALVLGIGIGIAFPLISDAAVSGAPRGRFAEASALNGTIRQFGATIGVAILAAVLGSAIHTGASSPFHKGWIFAACCYGLVAVGTFWMRPFAAPTYDADTELEPTSSGPRRSAVRPAAATGLALTPVPADPAALLAGVPLFSGLAADSLSGLAAGAETRHLRAGDWLFRAGDTGADMYVIRAGRLEVMADVLGRPQEVLQTLGPGAVVGELAPLAGDARSASVRARRDASLLRLRHEDLECLLQSDIGFGRSLARTLSRELQRSRRVNAGSVSRAGTVAVMLLGSGVEEVAHELVEGLRSLAGAYWLDEQRFGELRPGADVSRALAELLDRLEREHAVVALLADSRSGAWASACLQQADRVLALVGEHPDGAVLPDAPVACDAALLADADSLGVAEVLERLNPRSVQRIRPDGERSGDVARLARRLSGRAVGLVLSGGGARAFAHIGVIEELAAAGIMIDRVGAASTGAYVGALLALGMGPEEIDARCYEDWVRRNPLGDYTIPRVSILRGGRLRAMAQRSLPGRIEELPRTFYCVTTELDSGRLAVHRRGLLADAVTASMCLPGMVPPVRISDRLHVDGAILDGLPVAPMAGEAEGPVIACDVSGDAAAQRSRVGGEERMPSIVETLTRTVQLASADALLRGRAEADLVISTADESVGRLEFHAIDVMRDAGRRAALQALESAPGTSACGRDAQAGWRGRAHTVAWTHGHLGVPSVRCSYRCRITAAGTPAASVAAGTSCVTTAPAATTAPSPMFTPGRIVAAAPIHTFAPMVIGAAVMKSRRLSGSTGWPAVTRLTLWAIITSSAISMGA